MIFWIINKLPKKVRIYLKNGIFRRLLYRRLAEKTSEKIVHLSAEKIRNALDKDATSRDNTQIENTTTYIREALRYF